MARSNSTVLDDPRIDRDLLNRHGFDEEAFQADQQRIRCGDLTPESSVITAKIQPLPDVTRMAYDGPEETALRTIGEDALRRGAVAVVILNGGMATRFGGVVKGIVPVYDDRSFLSLKAEDVRRARKRFQGHIPLVLMNSFNTHEPSVAHTAHHDHFGLGSDGVITFRQSISLRLNRDGSLFIGEDGRPSYHTPGHGDLFASLLRSRTLALLLDRGVEYLIISNVDNLGATIDPVVLGHHVDFGVAMTIEVTEKRRTASGQWDRGGAPALVDSQPQIVEGFRFPPAFRQESLPHFSTNTIVFSAAAISQPLRLPRHMVEKAVEGRPAFQLESLMAEVAGVRRDDQTRISWRPLEVPRDDGTNQAMGRFYPVKTVEDLAQDRELIRRRLTTGWQLRDGPRS